MGVAIPAIHHRAQAVKSEGSKFGQANPQSAAVCWCLFFGMLLPNGYWFSEQGTQFNAGIRPWSCGQCIRREVREGQHSRRDGCAGGRRDGHPVREAVL